jgi:hypothetical protein
MAIEERVYQSEFWGEQPELPTHFSPVLFGCRGRYEAMDDEIRADTSEVSSAYPRPQFYDELEIGFGQSSDL